MFDSNNIPKTKDLAVSYLMDQLEEADVEYILENGSDSLHHFTGRKMRNGWKLWDNESVLSQYFIRNYQIAHADDISSLILDSVFALVKEENFDFNEKVEVLKSYWEKMGTNSLKAGGYKKIGKNFS